MRVRTTADPRCLPRLQPCEQPREQVPRGTYAERHSEFGGEIQIRPPTDHASHLCRRRHAGGRKQPEKTKGNGTRGGAEQARPAEDIKDDGTVLLGDKTGERRRHRTERRDPERRKYG